MHFISMRVLWLWPWAVIVLEVSPVASFCVLGWGHLNPVERIYIWSSQNQSRITLNFLLEFFGSHSIWIWIANPDKHWLVVVNSEGTFINFFLPARMTQVTFPGLFLIILTQRVLGCTLWGPSFMQDDPSAISPVPMPCEAIKVTAQCSQGSKDSLRVKTSFGLCLPTCVSTFTSFWVLQIPFLCASVVILLRWNTVLLKLLLKLLFQLGKSFRVSNPLYC